MYFSSRICRPVGHRVVKSYQTSVLASSHCSSSSSSSSALLSSTRNFINSSSRSESSSSSTKSQSESNSNNYGSSSQSESDSNNSYINNPLLSSLLASGLVIGGLSVSPLFAEENTVQALPPYDPDKTLYDETTYNGRVLAMKAMIDMSTLLVDDFELANSQKLLQSWDPKKGRKYAIGHKYGYTEEENKQFWEAKRKVQAIIHPITGEKMFLPGRMSAFVPVNVPISLGMLTHGTTSPLAQAFWQWINQTANVACNYANRSGAEIDSTALLQSYCLAVGTAMACAISMGKLVSMSPALQSLGLFVPYCSVCMASAGNMFFTRMEEIQKGIPVYGYSLQDKDSGKPGELLGLSKTAGFQGVWRTVQTRGWVTPIPILVIPPMIMIGLRKVIPKGGMLLMAEVTVLAGCMQVVGKIVNNGDRSNIGVGGMYFALPYTLALQPQTMEFKPSDLEEEFHTKKLKNGKPIEVIKANKGL